MELVGGCLLALMVVYAAKGIQAGRLDGAADLEPFTEAAADRRRHRLLAGEQGHRMRHLATLGGQAHRMVRAIRKLHESHGVVFHLENSATEIGEGGLTLKNGGSLAADIVAVHPPFPASAFKATAGLDELALLERARYIAAALAACLPPSYPDAIDVLPGSLGPQHESEELIGGGMGPSFTWHT